MKRGFSAGGSKGKRPRGDDQLDDDLDEAVFDEETMALEDTLASFDDSIPSEDTLRACWSRGCPDSLIDNDVNLAFQWCDIDVISGSPLPSNPDGTKVIGSTQGPVPIIRLYGVTAKGSSVLAFVHGFVPYMYASVATGIDISAQNLPAIRNALDQKMKDRAKGEEKKIANFILGVDREANKQSLLGYHFGQTKDFLKVYVALPSLVPSVKRIFDEGFIVPGLGSISGQTYESNVPFVLRFMIDCGINGSDWIEVPAGSYCLRDKKNSVSRCSMELDVTFNNLRPKVPEGVWSALAPLRILSFDIECQGRKGHFPDAQSDPVIQIANTVTLQGSEVPIIRNVFTLNTCLPIVNAQVICSESEEEMLSKWRDFVVSVDPDILTGYNIANFDIPYLLNRAKALEKKSDMLKKFSDLGKIKVKIVLCV